MHFEKLTKGTPHEPMSLMNNNTYPPWLINHQGIQPFFLSHCFESLTTSITSYLLQSHSVHVPSLQLIRSSWDLTCTRAHCNSWLEADVSGCLPWCSIVPSNEIFISADLWKKKIPFDCFLIEISLKRILLGAQKGYPPWVVPSPQIKTHTPRLDNLHPSM